MATVIGDRRIMEAARSRGAVERAARTGLSRQSTLTAAAGVAPAVPPTAMPLSAPAPGLAAPHRTTALTVVIVGPAEGRDLSACLATVSAQDGVDHVDVVVADRPSSPHVEAARSHPRVDRVVLSTHGTPGALVGRALWSVRLGVVAVLSAQARPDRRWLRDALAAFATGADAVWAPTATEPGLLLDMGSVWGALWQGWTPRLPPGDDVHSLRRWVGSGGLWCVDVSRMPPVLQLTAPDLRAPTEDSDTAMAPAPFAGLISVVVCSTGRPEALARCLRSLQRLDDRDHELLVVDNGADRQYDTALIEAAGGRHLHEPRRGLDHARNRGYLESSGEVIAYIDDDCEADPMWLTGVRRAMADPVVGLVAGRVLPASLARPSERWFEAWFGFDRGAFPDRCDSTDARPSAVLYPSLLGTGANMAYRRAVLDEIGGFDELLDVGSAVGGGGDIDAFARVLDSGAVGVYEPTAVVVHHHRTDLRALRRQFFGYGQALGAVCVKYALDRRGHKRAAVRFYRDRLRDQRRRLSRSGSQLPRSLTVIEMAGQLHGPFAYLRSRLRLRRRP